MIEFYKMSGSGNDFILIDNREHAVEAAIGSRTIVDFVKAVCEPKVSLGAEDQAWQCERVGNPPGGPGATGRHPLLAHGHRRL